MSYTKKSASKRVNLGLWAIIALAIAFACGWGQSKAAPFPSTDQSRFSVTVTGHGPDIILIPGWSSSAQVWNETVEAMKGDYRLHVLQLAGFSGESSGANAQGDVIAPVAEVLNAYIITHELSQPVIIGHSMGGFIGLTLARDHPQSLSQLIIVDSLPYYALIFHPAPTPEIMRPTAKALRASLTNMSDDAFRNQQQSGLSRQSQSDTHRAQILEDALRSDRKVLAQALYDLLTLDARPDLSRVLTPVTIIYPHSPTTGFTPEQTDQFYRTAYKDLVGARFVRVDDSLHFIMYDQAEQLTQTLMRALTAP